MPLEVPLVEALDDGNGPQNNRDACDKTADPDGTPGIDLPTRAFSAMTRERAEGFILVLSGPMFGGPYQLVIADLALKHGLPMISNSLFLTEAGGLMSYLPSETALFRRAAAYVDKILKGAKPADLPVERPTQFELVIN
ncbi:MAG: ABC transporter substrate binding protein, partial [Alphaproteobacteria bacterium]